MPASRIWRYITAKTELPTSTKAEWDRQER